MGLIQDIEKASSKTETYDFNVGDSVEVGYRIKEGDKERIQIFAGTVIAIKGAGVRKTFIVRRIVQGGGVERTFLLHSPRVASIAVTRRGVVRRAKLYYLRDRVGKATKVKEKIVASTEKKVRKTASKSAEAKSAEAGA
jgi:large subunit ribosomal protein L19